MGIRKDSYLSKPAPGQQPHLNVKASVQSHTTTQRATTAAPPNMMGAAGKQKLESFVTPRKDTLMFLSGHNANQRPVSSKVN